MLSVDDVTVRFGARAVLDGVSLAVADGEIVALVGASGSGKSTLLRVVAGIVRPDAGTVTIDGRDVTATPIHERQVGMVFQDLQLFPHLDVADNIGFGLTMRGVDRAERRRRTDELLRLVGLDGFGSRRITALSGGEARRVALARSLAPRPVVLLLDEPFTGLDRELHDRLVTDVGAILRAEGTTALVVTHDHAEAAALADRTVALGALAAASTGPVIEELHADETHDLRRSVLRDGTVTTEVRLDGDDEADTVHLGIRGSAGQPVAVSTWLRRPWAGEPGTVAVQLRGMATAPSVRGTGYGDALLTAGLDRARAGGAGLVWAHARVTALGFYERAGFDIVGDEYVDGSTGLPHRDVVRCF